MFSINKFLRNAAVVSLATAAMSVTTFGTSASAAPSVEAPKGPQASQQAPALSPQARAFLNNRRSQGLCVNAHIQDIGWQGWECGRNVEVGTTGQGKRIEALAFESTRLGGVYAQAHVQDKGWMRVQGGRDRERFWVGTTGESKRLEAVRIGSRESQIWAQAHVQDIGWMRADRSDRRGPAEVGTVGLGKRLEALRVGVAGRR